jgi:hypothetical protein
MPTGTLDVEPLPGVLTHPDRKTAKEANRIIANLRIINVLAGLCLRFYAVNGSFALYLPVLIEIPKRKLY